jgi:hypothetical protein
VENKHAHKTRNQVSRRNLVSGLWYPFLIAAYPVLGLLAHNVGEARPEAGLRPMAAVMLGAAVLMGLLRLLLRDWPRAAFVTAAWIGLFEAYGHVYIDLQEKAPGYAQTNLIAGASLLAAASVLFAASRPKVRFEAWTGPLNMAAAALVLIPVGQIAWYQVDVRYAPGVRAESSPVNVEGTRPDIYYIILDMYTRADTLKTAYGYDNSEFIGGLEGLGFRVADCSMSNYLRTELSLASSLNMTYLTSDLDARINPDSLARTPMWNMIRNNKAMEYVKARGYKTVAFATGFPWSELDNADVYLEPSPLRGGMTEFESLWLETTAFRALQEEGMVNLETSVFNRYRERTQFVLDTLPTLATMDVGAPKFVFAHLILPHPPFVFAADGSRADAASFLNEKEQYPSNKLTAGYTMQVTFANQAITQVIQEIIANSKTPPVIIIQGDHGPWLQPKDRRLTILNAYYLPGHADAITATITPVNTFRIIFDLYLGGTFGQLPNQSYFSPVPEQYDFELVPNRCQSK